MNRLITTIILFLILTPHFGNACDHCHSAGESQQASDLFGSIDSYYTPEGKSITNMPKEYYKGLELIRKGANTKAYKYFEHRYEKSKSSAMRAHAAYQLAHYDYFGNFDRYYNGIPSNIARPAVKQGSGRAHNFDNANYRSCILMSCNPKLASYNLEYVVKYAGKYLGSNNKSDREFAEAAFEAACRPNLNNKLDLSLLWRKSHSSYFDVDSFKTIEQHINVLPYLCAMQNAASADAKMTASECYRMAEAIKGTDKASALYYYTRAAFFGNVDAYKALCELSIQYNKSKNDSEVRSKSTTDGKDICKLEGLEVQEELFRAFYKSEHLAMYEQASKVFYDAAKKQYDEYNKYLHAKWDAEYQAKMARRQQRLQTFGNVLLALGQAATNTINQIAYSQYSAPAYHAPAMPNVSNLDYLIDPNYAIAQVAAQEQAEYMAAREAAQRRGYDLSIDEWRMTKAQAAASMSTSAVSSGSSSGSSYSSGSSSSRSTSVSTGGASSKSTNLCLDCCGSGKCSQCHGSGFRTDNMFGTGVDPKHKCGICSGTGRCTNCHGAGRI